MVSIKKVVAVVLSLIVGCSANNSAQNNIFKSTSSASSQSQILKDTLIIPGKRVGTVTKETTRADLVKMFGESKLTDDVILEDEGTISVPATKVNLGAFQNFTVAWEESAREKLLYITDLGSAWKTPEGIGVGTSLQELRQKLGEFKLTGLGWDYGGFVNLETTKLSEYQGKLSLRLSASDKASQKYSQQYQAILSDEEFSSSNPNWQPLDLKVSQMTVQFDE